MCKIEQDSSWDILFEGKKNWCINACIGFEQYINLILKELRIFVQTYETHKIVLCFIIQNS